MDTYQAQDLFVESVGVAAHTQKSELIALLRKNGVKVPDDISERDLISVTMVACVKSTACRADLTNFLADNVIEEQVGYVQEDFFNLTKEEKKKRQDEQRKLRDERRKKQGGTTAGNIIRSQEAKDTLLTGLNAAISGLFKGKSKDEANQTVRDVTDQADQAGKDASGKGKSKWVLPAIIGGVLLIGVIVYFSTRGKGKA